jgi:hypothetical protein
MPTYRYGSVISSLELTTKDTVPGSNTLNGEIQITHHQDQIFIVSSKQPIDLDIPVKKLGRLPQIDLTMETYVNLSSLSNDLQAKVREELKVRREVNVSQET